MKKAICAVIAVVMLALSAPAWAGSILELEVGDHARVFYRKGGDATGSGISIPELIFGSKDLGILGGHFAFTTGKFTGSQGSTLMYAPGGHFTITGCADRNGDHDHMCDKKDIQGVLMKGTFLNAKIVHENGETILIAQFLEQLNPALAALLKMPTQSEGVLELVLTGAGNCAGWTVGNVSGGSMSFLAEPSSLAILGTSLMGLFLIVGAAVRRTRTRAHLPVDAHL